MEKLREPSFIVVIFVIILAFVLDLVAFFFPTPIEHDLKVMILTTFNTGGFMSAVNYAIGSSAGSKNKEAEIARLTAKP